MAPSEHRTPSRIVRIGQIVPSSNTTMETEIPAMLRAREQHFPERFTFHSSRMRMQRVSAEELAAMNREGLRCAAELADARVDADEHGLPGGHHGAGRRATTARSRRTSGAWSPRTARAPR